MNKLTLILVFSTALISAACTPTATPTNTVADKAANTNTTATNSAPANTSGTNANASATTGNASNTNTKVEKTGGHSHTHVAPHGGTLVAFGEEFAHIELVLDKETGKLTVYALDGEAEKPVRLKQNGLEFEIKPAADAKPFNLTVDAMENGLTGEKIGDTSEFAGQSDALKGLTNFEAVLKSINIRGKDFKDTKFKFPEGNEGEHAHKDDKKHDHKEEKGKDHKH